MKMVIAIIQDYDCDGLLTAITTAGMAATKITSLGGFLRTRNITVLVGVEDNQVKQCIGIIERTCRTRVEVKLDPGLSDYADWYAAGIHEVTIGGGIVFVLNVSRFVKLPLAALKDSEANGVLI